MLVTPVSQKSRSLRTFISLGLSGLSLATLVAFTPASWGTAAAADPAPTPQPVSKGSLPNDVIQRVVRERYPDLQKCYQRLPEPPANTQIEMHFVIGSDGSVTSGHIDSAERPALGKCAEPIMKSMRFPAPTTGEVAVAYPIAFVSDTAEQKGRVTEPGADRSRLRSDISAPAPAGTEGERNVENGRLPREVILRVVKASYAEFRRCYEQVPDPKPRMRLKLNFTIGTSGRVTEGHVDAEENPSLGKCFEQVMFRLVFPAPEGGIVTVGYPIELAPG